MSAIIRPFRFIFAITLLFSCSFLHAKPLDFDFAGLQIPDNEQLKIRHKTGEGRFSEELLTIGKVIENDKEIYAVESKKESETTIIKFYVSDFSPILYHNTDDEGNTNKKIVFTPSVAEISIPKEYDLKKINIKPRTYDKSMLIYLFRAIPFNQLKKEIKFNFIVEAKSMGYQTVQMYVKTVGEEVVEAPAGAIPCYKVEMGATGFVGAFFMTTKFTYYFSKEAPHYFVKYSDPDGFLIELTDYQILK